VTWLPLTEAADLAGVSTRTLKRRIAAGELSAEKHPWGRRERWEVQAVELARWAEATGLALSVTAGELADRGGGHDSAPAGGESVTAPAENPDKLAALAAEADRLRAQVTALEGRLSVTAEALADARRERDRWAELATRLALPPATMERPRRSWWARLFGRGVIG